jgi:hypothetical protein
MPRASFISHAYRRHEPDEETIPDASRATLNIECYFYFENYRCTRFIKMPTIIILSILASTGLFISAHYTFHFVLTPKRLNAYISSRLNNIHRIDLFAHTIGQRVDRY